uniref:Uncharacterized protein n=1 Tax=Strix occidentalis caurina TaxID=311401 RepID=A0A8D0FM73_STROC
TLKVGSWFVYNLEGTTLICSYQLQNKLGACSSPRNSYLAPKPGSLRSVLWAGTNSLQANQQTLRYQLPSPQELNLQYQDEPRKASIYSSMPGSTSHFWVLNIVFRQSLNPDPHLRLADTDKYVLPDN